MSMSVKNIIFVKKIIFGILVFCENGKYLASIMDDSVITCDEIIAEIVPRNFNEICKTQDFYILLGFLLITIALLIGVTFTVI